jgi:hypothetical protein
MILRKLPRVGPCFYTMNLPARAVEDDENDARYYTFRWGNKEPSGLGVTTSFTAEEITTLYREMRRLNRERRKPRIEP